VGKTDNREINKRDWVQGIIYLLLYIGVVVWGAFLMLPTYWTLWLMVIAVLSYSLIVWHTRHFDYRCANCSKEFGIGVIRNIISPQGIGSQGSWKYLKCPKCGERTRAKVIKKVTF
jgi:DNA-directed RNA polymerase subunit RPC12/RpoP